MVCILKQLDFLLQVRDSDPTDTKRERIVQLIDDFKISGVNGVRILCDHHSFYFINVPVALCMIYDCV